MDFEPVAIGYYLEALAVDGDVVWYSDVIPGGIQRRLPDGATQEWMPGKQWIGSLAINEDGAILSGGAGGIAWFNPASGASGMLLETIDGTSIGGVNEIVHDGSGGLYFGTIDIPSIARAQSPGPSALYRLSADGRVTQLDRDLKFSNGIGVSADGRRLYHNETWVGMFAYDVAPDGSAGKPTPLTTQLDADGVAMDCEGNIWSAGYQSAMLTCLRPDGKLVRHVPLPVGGVSNIRFGGADNRDLYMTTVGVGAAECIVKGLKPERTSVLYKARWDVAGQAPAAPGFALGVDPAR